jgi:tetratricopeptide (TPR) repeat protein
MGASVLFVAATLLFARFGGPWVEGLDEHVAEVSVAKARNLVKAGLNTEARAAYEKALGARFSDPNQRVWALQELSQLLLEEKTFEEAATHARDAIERDEHQLKSYRLLSQALQGLGQLDKALAVERLRLAEAERQDDAFTRDSARKRIADLEAKIR